MRNSIILGFMLMLLAPKAFAVPSVKEGLDAILSSFDEDVNLGMMVKKADDATTLYEKHPDRYFTPASITKLFTSFVALKSLGQDFSFKTTLASDNKPVEGDVMNGNLYLTFTGDPGLSLNDLEQLFVTLKNTYNISQVTGQLVVDDTAFDEDYWVEGSAWDNQKFYYGAPVSPIIINKNTHQAMLVPGNKEGQKPELVTEKPMLLNMVLNESVTKHVEDPELCPLELKDIGENAYKIVGCIEPGAQPVSLRIAVKDPRVMLKKMLHMIVMKHQIRIEGGVRFEAAPEHVMQLASHESQPLSQLLGDMQRPSDNMIANVIFKTFGRAFAAGPGTFAMGKRVMQAVLEKESRVDTQHIKLVDGAGSSRYNRTTPRQVVELLLAAYEQEEIRDVFMNSLPQGGEGTLENRFLEDVVRSNIRVKTGSLTSVTGLSGYVKHPKEGWLIFSILNNGFMSIEKQKRLEDKLLTFLATGK